jgi:hypothetical protein
MDARQGNQSLLDIVEKNIEEWNVRNRAYDPLRVPFS